jgi:hypothetical protein
MPIRSRVANPGRSREAPSIHAVIVEYVVWK